MEEWETEAKRKLDVLLTRVQLQGHGFDHEQQWRQRQMVEHDTSVRLRRWFS